MTIFKWLLPAVAVAAVVAETREQAVELLRAHFTEQGLDAEFLLKHGTLSELPTTTPAVVCAAQV